MKATIRLMTILFTLLVGWGVIIWMQFSQDMAMTVNLLAMPTMMLVMAFLAVLAARESDM